MFCMVRSLVMQPMLDEPLAEVSNDLKLVIKLDPIIPLPDDLHETIFEVLIQFKPSSSSNVILLAPLSNSCFRIRDVVFGDSLELIHGELLRSEELVGRVESSFVPDLSTLT